MTEQEFGEYKNRVKALEHRVEKLELIAESIHEQNATLKELVVEIRHTNEHLNDHEKRLDIIEGRDSKAVSKWKESFISSLAGAIVGLIFGLIVWATKTGGA